MVAACICRWHMLALLTIFCACFGSHGYAEDAGGLLTITSEEYEAFTNSSVVRFIYFFKRDLPKIRNFLTQYEKASVLLASYDVKMAKMDCTGTAEGRLEYCQKDRSEFHVYAFRNGHEMIDLELDTMFDVNSVTSNVLQLLLITEVPIVQSLAERKQLELANKGTQNIIFGYHRAIGTVEHRVFMEVAYAYHSQHKFAFTTSLDTVKDLDRISELGDNPRAVVWVLQCKEDTTCQNVNYRDKIDLLSFSNFLKTLNNPLLYDVTNDITEIARIKEKFTNMAYLVYNNETRDSAVAEFRKAAPLYRGVLGFVHMNIDIMDTDAIKSVKMMLVAEIDRLPAFSMAVGEEEVPKLMKEPYTFLKVMKFINERLDVYIKLASGDQDEGDDSKSLGDEAAVNERLDDAVAEAVYRLRHTKDNLTLIPALTDVTFPQETTQRDVLMVLFYLDMDSKSKSFLKAYAQASKHYTSVKESPLARVECWDWTDVCSNANVHDYPTVRVYRRGQAPLDYLDTWSAADIVREMDMFAKTPASLSTEEEVNEFSIGSFPPGISASTNCSVMGIFETNRDNEWKNFQKVAHRLNGKFVFGQAVGPVAQTVSKSFNNIGLPYVLIFKREDPNLEDIKTTNNLSIEFMKAFIQESCLPVIPQLTATNFHKVMSRSQRLLLQFGADPGPGGLDATLGSMVHKPDYKDYQFATIDVSDPNALGLKILSTYTTEPLVPSLVLVDHSGAAKHPKGGVYIYKKHELGDDVTEEKLKAWLEDIYTKKAEPSYIFPDNTWEPAYPPYDFLRMMDEGVTERQEENLEDSVDQDSDRADGGSETPQSETAFQPDEEATRRDDQVDDPLSEDEIDARRDLIELKKSRLFNRKHHHHGDTHHRGDHPGRGHLHDDTQHPDYVELGKEYSLESEKQPDSGVSSEQHPSGDIPPVEGDIPPVKKDEL